MSVDPIDLLVHGGDVLTVDEAGTVVRGGAVAVHEGEIVAVGSRRGAVYAVHSAGVH